MLSCIELQLFDVKNAFLHRKLEEESFIKNSLGFRSTRERNKVCRLKKSLYELK